jgi:hypothetical protein
METTTIFESIEAKEREYILATYFDDISIIRRRVGISPNLGQGIWVIISGQLDIYVPVQRGNAEIVPIVLCRLREFDFLGEINYLRAYHNPTVDAGAAIIRGAPFEARRLRNGAQGDPRSTLLDLFQQHPRIGVNMLSEMARRLAATNRYVYPSAFDRTRLQLARLTENNVMTITVSAAEIARSVGYVREAVRNALGDLESEDIIALKSIKGGGFRITVLSRERLTEGLLIVP